MKRRQQPIRVSSDVPKTRSTRGSPGRGNGGQRKVCFVLGCRRRCCIVVVRCRRRRSRYGVQKSMKLPSKSRNRRVPKSRRKLQTSNGIGSAKSLKVVSRNPANQMSVAYPPRLGQAWSSVVPDNSCNDALPTQGLTAWRILVVTSIVVSCLIN